jgi:hypothetical protein
VRRKVERNHHRISVEKWYTGQTTELQTHEPLKPTLDAIFYAQVRIARAGLYHIRHRKRNRNSQIRQEISTTTQV